MNPHSMWKNLVESNHYAHGPDIKRVYYESVKDFIVVSWKIGICAVWGHELHEELISIESGHSELHCTRCGWSTDIWM